LSKENLGNLNIFSLKRLVVDRALDMVDSLSSKPEDVYRWYSLLSFQLARDYASLWKNQLRKNPEVLVHYQWAQQVPLQHLKSEVIIKLHMVFNHLSQK